MNLEPDICLSSTPIPIDETDKRVIDIGNRLKRDLETVLRGYKDECDALDVSINVCGTIDLVRYTKEPKRGYNAERAEQTGIGFRDVPINIWL